MNNRINLYLNEIFEKNEKNAILKNLLALKNNNQLAFLRIEEMLEFYCDLNRQKPFETLLVGDENTPDNQEIVKNYQADFKNYFLPLHKQEILSILTLPNLQNHINKIEVVNDALKIVKDMHDKPEEKLGERTGEFQQSFEKAAIRHTKPIKRFF